MTLYKTKKNINQGNLHGNCNIVSANDLAGCVEDCNAREEQQSPRRDQDAVQNEGRVSYQDFMAIDDQEIQNVVEVIVPLHESYFPMDLHGHIDNPRRDAFYRKLVKNRNITIVLDCDHATCIENYFLFGFSIHNINIINANNVSFIGDNFLYSSIRLTTLDLHPLSNVTDIGNHFLFDCFGLRTLDLHPLSNVTRIGDHFLANCSGLTNLDLRPLSNVTDIGNNFLSSCYGLRTLDLHPLSNVTRIGDHFLANCYGLTNLDLRPLSNVTDIGNEFLSECAGLKRESVTVPQNWRFERLIQPHLIRNSVAVMIDDLRRRHIDPKRAGSDYTPVEYGAASSLLQGAGELPEDYLRRLEEVFSRARAAKLLEDIINAEDNSSDSDGSDH